MWNIGNSQARTSREFVKSVSLFSHVWLVNVASVEVVAVFLLPMTKPPLGCCGLEGQTCPFVILVTLHATCVKSAYGDVKIEHRPPNIES